MYANLRVISIGGVWKWFHSISRPRKPYGGKTFIISEIEKKSVSHLQALAAILDFGSSIANISFREKCLILMFLIIEFSRRMKKEFLNSDHFEISQIMAVILDFGPGAQNIGSSGKCLFLMFLRI